MRRTLLAAVMFAVALVGCSAPAVTDPYVLTSNALDTNWQRVQLELSLQARVEGREISIARGDLRLAFDVDAGKGLFNMSLDPQALGITATELGLAGLGGGRLDVDVLFDGDALYGRSPLAAQFLPLLMGQFGGGSDADYSGWLKLATRDELEVLASLAAMGADSPDVDTEALDELRALSPVEMQQQLTAAGLSLTYVGSEQREGVQANHLRLVVDSTNLAQTQGLPGLDPQQLAEMAAAEVKITADLWLNAATSRPVELAFELTSNEPELESLNLAIYVGEPDASVTFTAPDSFVEVPVLTLIQQFMGGGFGG